MSLCRTVRQLGPDSGGVVTVDNISGATDTGKNLLQAADDAAARQQIGAMGTEGDQVIDGQLQVKEKITLTLPDSEVSEWVTIVDFPRPDGTVGASLDFLKWSSDASFLRFSVRTTKGALADMLTMTGAPGPNTPLGGIIISQGRYLLVNGNYYLDQITDTGYSVYTAPTKENARTAIDAMGTEGDQTINGQLELKNMLTVTLPQPVVDNWVPLINLAWPDGTVGAYTEYAHNAQEAVSLRLNIRTGKGKETPIWQIDPTDNGHGQVGGFEIVEGRYLKVGGKYYLNLVTDTGYGLLTAQDNAAARAAIGAGTSNLTASPFGEQILQCEDAAAVRALLGITTE
ncbi:hypothetical protein [Serratia marcescens]|uniref:hypothetical protein n=1 Tax=Serratia marcescens TaxID=615 RepID=UPI00124A0CE0|nr:hypothetical protein [Serratia marcescens]KAB1578752.1 hypothetical protein F7687_22735 [Serratia marcescens]